MTAADCDETVSGSAQSEIKIEESLLWNSVAINIILPLTVAAVIWGRRIINKTLLAAFCPKLSRRERLLKWITGTHLPLLEGGLNTIWVDGSQLCTLVNSVIPGACPNPHRHWRKPASHGQALVYKYLGVVPRFTEDDFEERTLTSNLETTLIDYLFTLQQAIARISHDEDLSYSNAFVARGMGLVTGEQHRKTTLYIYPNHANQKIDNLIISIRGPYGLFGSTTLSSEVFHTPTTKAQNQRDRGFFKTLSITNLLLKTTKDDANIIKIKMEIESDRAKVAFVPKNSGVYEVCLTTNGEHITGSPYNINIEKNRSGIMDNLESVEDKKGIRKSNVERTKDDNDILLMNKGKSCIKESVIPVKSDEKNLNEYKEKLETVVEGQDNVTKSKDSEQLESQLNCDFKVEPTPNADQSNNIASPVKSNDENEVLTNESAKEDNLCNQNNTSTSRIQSVSDQIETKESYTELENKLNETNKSLNNGLTFHEAFEVFENKENIIENDDFHTLETLPSKTDHRNPSNLSSPTELLNYSSSFEEIESSSVSTFDSTMEISDDLLSTDDQSKLDTVTENEIVIKPSAVLPSVKVIVNKDQRSETSNVEVTRNNDIVKSRTTGNTISDAKLPEKYISVPTKITRSERIKSKVESKSEELTTSIKSTIESEKASTTTTQRIVSNSIPKQPVPTSSLLVNSVPEVPAPNQTSGVFRENIQEVSKVIPTLSFSASDPHHMYERFTQNIEFFNKLVKSTDNMQAKAVGPLQKYSAMSKSAKDLRRSDSNGIDFITSKLKRRDSAKFSSLEDVNFPSIKQRRNSYIQPKSGEKSACQSSLERLQFDRFDSIEDRIRLFDKDNVKRKTKSQASSEQLDGPIEVSKEQTQSLADSPSKKTLTSFRYSSAKNEQSNLVKNYESQKSSINLSSASESSVVPNRPIAASKQQQNATDITSRKIDTPPTTEEQPTTKKAVTRQHSTVSEPKTTRARGQTTSGSEMNGNFRERFTNAKSFFQKLETGSKKGS